MKILNFGSCCIDNVYEVPHFVQPGETLVSRSHHIYPGGKGLNQSIALARAGVKVQHAGKVGRDGEWLRSLLADEGVDVSRVTAIEGTSGHANIQVTPEGENAIVIVGGSNRAITPDDFEEAFSGVSAGDFLLLQNEVSHMPDIIRRGQQLGLRLVFNAAPMTDEVFDYPLDAIEYLIVNETEAEMLLTGRTDSPAVLDDWQLICDGLAEKFPACKLVLTLGEAGAIYRDADTQIHQASSPVIAVDTTGAGDTFTGFFLAALAQGSAPEQCLKEACLAASISVTRAGAATSIPTRSELD